MRQPPQALHQFLAPYSPLITRLFLATRQTVLAAAPGATELIYDAYNAVTIAYSFTDRLREAFCHVAAYPNHVNLGFNAGATLADPDNLLAGTGAHIRHIRIGAAEDLERRGLQTLLRAAVEQGKLRRPVRSSRPQSIVKAIYPKKRRPQSGRR